MRHSSLYYKISNPAMRNKLIYAILSLLGLTTACSKDKYSDRDTTWWSENKNSDKGNDSESSSENKDNWDSVECMYGTPIVTFSVKGNVTDTDGRPIKGIRVKVDYYTSTLTDEQGKFGFDKVQMIGFGNDSFNKQLEFQDIDGEENGSFEDKEINVTFIRDKDVQRDTWYFGDYKAKDTDVVLQTKSEKE